MADLNPTDCGSLEPASPAVDDAKVERTILRFVLGEHPDQITMPEATRAQQSCSDQLANRPVKRVRGGEGIGTDVERFNRRLRALQDEGKRAICMAYIGRAPDGEYLVS